MEDVANEEDDAACDMKDICTEVHMAANSDVIRKLQSIHGDDVVRELLNSMDALPMALPSQRCTWPVAADLELLLKLSHRSL